MKKISKISSGLYIFLCFAFFYLPILVTVIFSYFVFKEKLSKKAFIGLCMMVMGTLLMVFFK